MAKQSVNKGVTLVYSNDIAVITYNDIKLVLPRTEAVALYELLKKQFLAQ